MSGSNTDSLGTSTVSPTQPGSRVSAERMHVPLPAAQASSGQAPRPSPTGNHVSEDNSQKVPSPADTSVQAEELATGRIAGEGSPPLAVQEARHTSLTRAISSSSLKKFIPRHNKARSEGGFQRRKTPGRNNTDLRRTLSAVDPGISTRNEEEPAATNQNNDNNSRDAFTQPARIASMSGYDPTILQHRLIVALEKDCCTKKDFMPRCVLDRIISQETVDEELSGFEYLPRKIRHRTWRKASYVRIGSSKDREATGSDDLPPASKPGDPAYYQLIFSILTYMGRSRKIWSFVNEGISDQCLPLIKKVVRGERIELRRHDASEIGLKCLKKPKDVIAFAELQWHFFVPLFGKVRDNRIVHCKAMEGQILPFLDWQDKGRSGAFGSVYQARVHDDHHGFNSVSAPNGIVAIKKLVIKDRDIFHKEWKTLRHLQSVNHRHHHLIPFLGTFEQNDCYYLILPWAEADLENYWKLQYSQSDGNDAGVLAWVLQQIQGLAEAVSRIHRYDTLSGSSMLNGVSLSARVYSPFPGPILPGEGTEQNVKHLYGRHGDIKPANILWFPGKTNRRSDGILRLSDFGTTCFTSGDNVSQVERKSVPDKGTYQPPECQFPSGILSSQCDVWSLGCVFLEFICWFMGGANLLVDFEQRRKRGFESDRFFTVDPEDLTARVKKPVIEMIRELQNDDRCNRALRDVLKIIETDMLVVNNATLNTLVEQDEADNSATSDHLQVHHPTWHRRKSSGNVARDVGGIIDQWGDHVIVSTGE